jgi:HPt (histidine-containing phosphotransfer) domain-containing protein
MAQFRSRFVAAAAGEAGELEQLLQAGDHAGVRRIAHGLAGRAGMFGFHELGETARSADEADDDSLLPHGRRLLEELRALGQER